MSTTKLLSLDEIGALAHRVLLANGANEETARVLADVIVSAERDGHGGHGFKQLLSYAVSISEG